jgi:hypothetical protein
MGEGGCMSGGGRKVKREGGWGYVDGGGKKGKEKRKKIIII